MYLFLSVVSDKTILTFPSNFLSDILLRRSNKTSLNGLAFKGKPQILVYSSDVFLLAENMSSTEKCRGISLYISREILLKKLLKYRSRKYYPVVYLSIPIHHLHKQKKHGVSQPEASSLIYVGFNILVVLYFV